MRKMVRSRTKGRKMEEQTKKVEEEEVDKEDGDE